MRRGKDITAFTEGYIIITVCGITTVVVKTSRLLFSSSGCGLILNCVLNVNHIGTISSLFPLLQNVKKRYVWFPAYPHISTSSLDAIQTRLLPLLKKVANGIP